MTHIASKLIRSARSSIVRNYAGEGTQSSSAQSSHVRSAARRMTLGIGEPFLTSTHLAVNQRG
jgi:hypothetical protein